MYLEVRHVVLTLECPHIDLDTLNRMLRVALEFEFCDVTLNLGDVNTKLELHFKNARTSIFVEQWVLFWMRPFDVKYELNFDIPENGKQLTGSFCSIAA